MVDLNILTKPKMTKEEVAEQTGAKVYTLDEFAVAIENGEVASNLGIGFFHTGFIETIIEVFDNKAQEKLSKSAQNALDFQYVCWYPAMCLCITIGG